MTIRIADPDLQIEFAARLATLRGRYLQDALGETVRSLSVPIVDRELEVYVPSRCLAALAGRGMRGETVFPVPVILQANPNLLGYYRLLYGYSQKEFYTAASGVGRFKRMEEKGALPNNVDAELPVLCREMCRTGTLLLDGIGMSNTSVALFDDLTLLTLGPQLRGGANVRKGAAAIRMVFNAIHDIVRPAVVETTETRIRIENAAGRVVSIEFAADPDIVIKIEMQPGQFRLAIAIEVKGGADFSNIHNRIGEAEKSHQKAKNSGYAECWTVVNVDNFDLSVARTESPSTNRFFKLSDLTARAGSNYQNFSDLVTSVTGIPTH